MPAQLEIRGTADFRRTAAKLKKAGNGKLTRDMAKRMRAAAKPAVDDAARAVNAVVSKGTGRGGGGQQRRTHTLSRKRKLTDKAKQSAFEGRGLRKTIGRSLTTKVSARGSALVQIRANSSMLPRDQRKLPMHMNRGTWRHPVFGDRDTWVTQTVTPAGWFDRTMQRHGPKVHQQAVQVVGDINQEIARG